MSVPHYPYGDGNRSVPQPGPPVRPQEDSWAPPGAYGMGTRYPWPSAAPSGPPGSLYMNESTSSWPTSGSPQPPPSPPPPQPKVGGPLNLVLSVFGDRESTIWDFSALACVKWRD